MQFWKNFQISLGVKILNCPRIHTITYTYFMVYNLVSVYPKSILLAQMTNLNVRFYVVASIYRLV